MVSNKMKTRQNPTADHTPTVSAKHIASSRSLPASASISSVAGRSGDRDLKVYTHRVVTARPPSGRVLLSLLGCSILANWLIRLQEYYLLCRGRLARTVRGSNYCHIFPQGRRRERMLLDGQIVQTRISQWLDGAMAGRIDPRR